MSSRLSPHRKALKLRWIFEHVTDESSGSQKRFAITPAYAFTDYRAQGQTIESVIVNITAPPDGGRLSLANLYVALSRSSGRETIRILRDFNEKLLAQPLDPDPAADDERLEELEAKTKLWCEGMKSSSASGS
ncbi:hypothetical protein FRC10_008796 [Ceratobasidium sp. 414]|nr:hypothetical protein FRC10_008796 [Ceratobasidium sp. 414]